MNAGRELDDTNLSLLVQIGRLNFEQVGPSSQAIRLASVVERVEHLHYN